MESSKNTKSPSKDEDKKGGDKEEGNFIFLNQYTLKIALFFQLLLIEKMFIFIVLNNIVSQVKVMEIMKYSIHTCKLNPIWCLLSTLSKSFIRKKYNYFLYFHTKNIKNVLCNIVLLIENVYFIVL